MSEHECGCGFEAESAQGLGAHQRHCDEEEETDTSETTNTVSTGVADASLSDLEAAVIERDDGECRRCGSDESLDIHAMDPSGKEYAGNYRTLCDGCDEELEGLTVQSKKDEIRRGPDL